VTRLEIAWTAAALTSVFAASLPADRNQDRHFRSWVSRSRYRLYWIRVLLLQLVATGIVAAAAHQLHWLPERGASAFTSSADGFGWAFTAMLLLRADFGGLRADEATPGFSLLRTAVKLITGDVADATEDRVRVALPSDLDSLRDTALAFSARAYPPRPDGTRVPDAVALAANIVLLHEGASGGNAADRASLQAVVVETVMSHRLRKL